MKKIFVLLLVLALLCGCTAAPVETTAPETTVPETTEQAVQRELYVLMYHSVAPDGTLCGEWTITAGKFREHMQYIRDKGYTVVAPSDLVSGAPLPEKAVMITLDDGYADNVTNAMPILKEFGYKAVVALITSCMELDDPYWLDWDMCRQAVESGVLELGVHTHDSHRYPGIRRLEGETQEEYEARIFPDLELAVSKIQENTSVAPVFFAYPRGIVDEWAVGYINEHFPVTVTTREGVNDPANGFQHLMRWNMNDTTDISAILP